jgi:putative oxidoreductase
LQRLFSNFANGWPGRGLLAQRVLIVTVLIHSAVTHFKEASGPAVVPELIGVGLGIFILIGFWTPVAGTLLGLIEAWIIFSRIADPWIPSILATLGITLAMIGPGAWSVDARLFGRKHIQTPQV